MPELPEVEQFRQILLPLVSQDLPVHFQLMGDQPPRKWLTAEDCAMLSNNNNHWYCTDILRKGKQLCMVLEQLLTTTTNNNKKKKKSTTATKYLYLHMGMTGRVVSPGRMCVLENVKDDGSVFPPKYTYLLMQTTENYPVAFADPRKFGSCELKDSLQVLDELAPDAWLCQPNEVVPKLVNQSTGIKALLLDQKRAVSGVGNWVADELFYQLELHPDQTRLSQEQAQELMVKLQEILTVAVDCLRENKQYPMTWLFNYRWTKKKAGKDHHGRNLTFVTSGGRTSVIIASVQKLRKRQVEEPTTETIASKATATRKRTKQVIDAEKAMSGPNSASKTFKVKKETTKTPAITVKPAEPTTSSAASSNRRARRS
jgi:formamidopyrimidine-DNA glycosylase